MDGEGPLARRRRGGDRKSGGKDQRRIREAAH
jgi:hypothetical protein